MALHTTRIGGESRGVYHSMNLGLSSGDDHNVVARNRMKLLNSQGIEISRIATVHQIHSNHVIDVSEPGNYKDADGLITSQAQVFLTVSSADCASVLIAHKQGKAIAALHSGWRGTFSNICGEAIMKMKNQYQINPADLYAYIGPCMSAKAFEVDHDVYEKFDKKYFIKKDNKWLFNMKGVLSDQLKEAGIPDLQTEISPNCTYLEPELFFSYRRDKGNTGRMWASIGIAAKPLPASSL